jgi:hypothetical protein
MAVAMMAMPAGLGGRERGNGQSGRDQTADH